MDEDIAVKLIHLSLILLDEANVVLQFFEPVAHHAALDAALKSSLLVMGKIYSRGVTQKRKEFFQFGASRNGRGFFALGDCGRDVGMPPDSGEFFSDFLRRSDKVYAACIDRTARHAAVFGRFLILGECDSAGRLNGGAACGSIRCSAR